MTGPAPQGSWRRRRLGPMAAGALAGATAGALVVSLTLSRARQPVPVPPTDEPSAPSDDEIRRHVEAELVRWAPPGADLRVEVVEGVATLRGEVVERADADEIVSVLGQVAGVLEVQGLLQVLGAARPGHPVGAHRS